MGLDVEGMEATAEAYVNVFDNMYAQINELHANQLISERDAASARAQIYVQEQELKFRSVSGFFGDLSSLSKLQNEKLARAGKAAALTEAAIAGYLAIQRALAAPPGWPYNAAGVISTGIMQAANVAAIAGFENGGYTGSVGRKEVAGAVHGQEYVMNAATTARVGVSNLDRIQAGGNLQGTPTVNSNVEVNIENYGTSKTFEYQISPNEVRIIARDEIAKNTPDLVANEIANPQSRVSKSISKNTQAPRRRQ
jgi:hypothetical protein